MRTLLKVTMDAVSGNKSILEGSLPKLMQSTMESLKPESAYFYAANGKRTAMMVFDMKDASEIPSICEPFFMGLNADVELIPVMNADDLKKGLEVAMKAVKK